MALLDGRFDVLWIVVLPPNNDQVFQSACQKQFVAMEKSQVSCSQKGSFARIPDVRSESPFRLGRSIPISLTYTGPGNPDFTYLTRWANGHRLRGHDHQALLWQRTAATHQELTLGLILNLFDRPGCSKSRRFEALYERA